MVGVARDAGRHPEQDLLGRAERGDDPLEPRHLVERIEHDVPHPGVERLSQLGLGLRVAVKVDPGRIEAAPERERELSAGGDVTGQPLLGEHSVDGGARERLRAEQDVVVPVTSGQRVQERPRSRAQIVLRDDVRRRAEPGGQLDRVAPPDLEPPALVHARVEREHVHQIGGRQRHHGGDHASWTSGLA